MGWGSGVERWGEGNGRVSVINFGTLINDLSLFKSKLKTPLLMMTFITE